jgi:hypothetical protein
MTQPTIIKVAPKKHYSAELKSLADGEVVAKASMQAGDDTVRIKFPKMDHQLSMSLADWTIFKDAVDSVIQNATAKQAAGT